MSQVSDDLDRLMGKCPTAEVLIAGHSVSCILDNGAETSLISYEFFRDHLQKIDKFDLVIQSIHVVGAIPAIGVVDVPIIVGRHTVDGSLLVRDQCVCSHSRRTICPVIMGCNILREIVKVLKPMPMTPGDSWGMATVLAAGNSEGRRSTGLVGRFLLFRGVAGKL